VAAPTRTGQHTPQRTGRRLGWIWVPVVFLVGLLSGGVIVAVFSNGTTVRPPGPTTTVTATPSSGGPQVSIDAACLQALHDAQGAYALLGRVSDAVRNLDASRLDEIALQLAQLRHQLAEDLGGCHATAQLPGGATPSR
jgi:hypothetical protein